MLRRTLLLACVALVVTLSSTSNARAWYAGGYRAGGVAYGGGYRAGGVAYGGGYRAGGVAYGGGYRAGGVAYGGCAYGAYGGYRGGCVRRW